MFAEELHQPLTVERFRRLVFETAPQVVWFEAGQSRAERAALMAAVPEDAQRAARSIMVEDILCYLDYLAGPEYADKPLLFFMATDEEDDEVRAAGDEEARHHSDDWRMIVFAVGDDLLCDFNGWPGDNENGAGVFVERGSGRALWLFGNGDASLASDLEPLEEAIGEYEVFRQTLGHD